MKWWRALLAAAALACTATVTVAAAPAGVRVEHAWIRWLPAGLPVAGYAVLVNAGDGTVNLTGATSPAYGMVMLHHSRLAHSDSTMEPVASLALPAHTRVALVPGAYHLMLSHATRAIKPGDRVPVILEFGGGATLEVTFAVLPANATGPD